MKSGVQHGLTLIELMVVIGLIGLMAGGLSLALGPDRPATALRTSQGLLAGLVRAARAQAALSQTRASLVIDADPASASFLRAVHVAVEISPESDRWAVMSVGATLPSTIFVIPPAGLLAEVGYSTAGGPWPRGGRSTVHRLAGPQMIAMGRQLVAGALRLDIAIEPAGQVDPPGGAMLAIAAGRRTPTGVEFPDPSSLRGVVISEYGVPLLVGGAGGFDF